MRDLFPNKCHKDLFPNKPHRPCMIQCIRTNVKQDLFPTKPHKPCIRLVLNLTSKNMAYKNSHAATFFIKTAWSNGWRNGIAAFSANKCWKGGTLKCDMGWAKIIQFLKTNHGSDQFSGTPNTATIWFSVPKGMHQNRTKSPLESCLLLGLSLKKHRF